MHETEPSNSYIAKKYENDQSNINPRVDRCFPY
jgi:hypothetical protein